MPHSDEYRRGCVTGARLALDNAIPHVPPHQVREIVQWLHDLERWTEGPMPLSPMEWPEVPDALA